MIQSKDIVVVWIKVQKPIIYCVLKVQKPIIYCVQETHLRTKDTNRLKLREWEKIFHANEQDRKAGVARLLSDKIDFKLRPSRKTKKDTI